MSKLSIYRIVNNPTVQKTAEVLLLVGTIVVTSIASRQNNNIKNYEPTPKPTLIPIEDMKEEKVAIYETRVDESGNLEKVITGYGTKYSLKYPDITPEPTKSR